MRARHIVLMGFAAIVACASSLPVERRDYVLAHPHGWVELKIDDRGVPLIPDVSYDHADKASVKGWVKPAACWLAVSIAGEAYVSGVQVIPQGERPPFRADSGIRFPVPVGTTVLKLAWGGCRVEGEKIVQVEHEIFIPVELDRVTEVLFDGAALSTSAPREDRIVTLDDVYEAVTGKRKGE